MRHPDDILPSEVARLLHPEDQRTREDAWAELVARHTPLLLQAAYSALSTRDDAMDAYAFVLEQLRGEDYRRFRTYGADGRCKFSTWLVVVARRACIDFARQKYGRYKSQQSANGDDSVALRRLLAGELRRFSDADLVVDEGQAHADAQLRETELTAILEDSLNELPADDQLLIKLRFSDDLAAREIAQLMGLASPFHVYRRLNGILLTLRRRLTARGVMSSVP